METAGEDTHAGGGTPPGRRRSAFVPRRVKLGMSLDRQVAGISRQTDFADTVWLTVAPYERENGPGRVRIARGRSRSRPWRR